MPVVDHHASGTPSWIDLGSPDPDASAPFYCDLFGWTVTSAEPVEETGGYRMFQLDGRDVAGLGPQQAPGRPYWTTYVTVGDAEAAVGRVSEAGGSVLAPVMDVLDAGRMAVCADPEGAAFSVWQPLGSIGAQVVNEPGSLTWNELMCRDPERAKRFYGAVFGWTANELDMGDSPYVEWQADGRTVGGMMPMVGDGWGTPEELPAHWMVYFAVEDTDATAIRCEELGGHVSVPPTDIPPGRFAVLDDPHGAVFSVVKLAAGRDASS